ncbi:MAG: HigA family addiction module antidote protein [Algoriphagus sp.]|nr:HigA family addiction module antidote protein [Algoriphagus sp.]
MKLKTQEDIDLVKSLISPPGDTLLETITELGISQSDLANRMARPIKTINEIIQGKTAITPETAIQLERVTGVPADFWLEREKNYRLELAEILEAERVIQEKEWLANFPIKEMIKLEWIQVSTKDPLEWVEAIFRFFRVGNKVGFYNCSCYTALDSPDYRLTNQDGKNPYALAAWLRKGEIQAETLEVADYDKKKFKDSLQDIKQVMVDHPEDFFARLTRLAGEAGVKVVHTPSLPHAKVHGATRWIGDTPVIQLSNQFKRNDIFWFTFFHEAGHILKHGKKDLFIEGIEPTELAKVKEQEADDFAISLTFSVKEEAEFMALGKNGGWTTKDVSDFAKKVGTHPAMIVGRLERNKIITPGQGYIHGFYQKIEL